MHLVDNTERLQQLKSLVAAIQAFLPVLAGVEDLRKSIPAYEACVAEAERLVAEGFSQADLSNLSRAVPCLFWIHKEWMPQLEQATDGNYSEPSWFRVADSLHQAVHDAAEELRVIGRY